MVTFVTLKWYEGLHYKEIPAFIWRPSYIDFYSSIFSKLQYILKQYILLKSGHLYAQNM